MVQFFVKDYFNSFGIDEMDLDEGFWVYFWFKIQVNCLLLEVQDFLYIFSLCESVEEMVYCISIFICGFIICDWIFNGVVCFEVLVSVMQVCLCSVVDFVNIFVDNVFLVDVFNVFVNIISFIGGLVVSGVFDVQMGMVIVDNGFGVYVLGDILVVICWELWVVVWVNICEIEELEFFIGWDCEEVLVIIVEVVCLDIGFIIFIFVIVGMNFDVISLVINIFILFCEEVVYELDVCSINLGYFCDIIVCVGFLLGQEYIFNFLEIVIFFVGQGGIY